jgi:hypothetical protein
MRFLINGRSHDVSLDPRTSLLDLLREHLRLTGTKKGCDQGACGACTVLVEGVRINSCLALAVQYEGREITTVEGLAAEPELHPLQRAFIEHDGFRFGWSKRNPVPRSQREGDWLIGYGVATATYPYYRMPGGAARIRLTSDGHAIVQMGSHEMGMGTATVQAQLAAELLALPVECVRFEYGDSSFPRGTAAGGSSQTARASSVAASSWASGWRSPKRRSSTSEPGGS